MSLLQNGLGITLNFQDMASAKMKNVTRLFQQMRMESEAAAREVPRNFDRAVPRQGLSGFLHRDMTEQINRVEDELDQRFARFTRNVRNQVNTFNSIIMGGVALSMSGLGLSRAGQGIFRTVNHWVASAEEFEKTMREIKFLGRTSEREYAALRDTIIDIGIRLPLSNLEVAQGVLDTLKVGFTAQEAKDLAEVTAEMTFFANGALTTAESAQFFNAILKQTAYEATDARLVLDMLTKTTQITAFNMGELWSAWRSSRAGLGNLETDLETFLTLMGVARTTLTPRFAGMVVNSFSRALLQASSSTGNRGILWDMLGINLNEVRDPIKVLEIVSKKSRELWGETAERRANLVRLFGTEALPIFQAYDNFMKNSAMSMEQIRDAIRDSTGFSNDYMMEMMDTLWGLRQVYQGTMETFRQVMGELFAPILIPALRAAQNVMARVVELIQSYPTIARLLGYGVGLTGVLLTLGGVALLVVGQIMSIYGSLNNAVLQVAVLNYGSASKLKELGQEAVTVGKLIDNKLLLPFRAFAFTAFKMLGMGALLYTAWRYDFFRLRSVVTGFFTNLGNAWRIANDAMNNLTATQLIEKFNELRLGGTWDKMAARIIYIAQAWDALSSAIKNYQETGQYMITEDQFKMLEHIGLADDIGKIIDYIVAIQYAWRGFVSGMQDGFELLNTVLFQPLLWILDKIYRVIVFVGKGLGFFQNIGGPELNAWERLGQMAGTLLATIIGIKIAIASWTRLLLPVIKLFAFLTGKGGTGGGGGLLGKIFNTANMRSAKSTVAKTGAALATGAKGAATKSGRTMLGQSLHNFLFGAGTGTPVPRTKVAAGRIPRVHSLSWLQKPDVHPATGVRLEHKGLIPRLLHGSRAYSWKTGQEIGHTRGLLHTATGQKITNTLAMLKQGKLGGLASKIPWLGAGITGLSMLTAERGKRLDTGVRTATSLAGVQLGGKLGATLGTMVAGPAGTIVGGILGAVVGSLAATPFGGIISGWIHKGIDALKAALGGIGNVFRAWFSGLSRTGVPTDTARQGVTPTTTSGTAPITNVTTRRNVSNSRRFARGGLIWGAQNIVAGEDGPEAIIPLSKKYRHYGLPLWEQVGEVFGGTSSPSAAQVFSRYGTGVTTAGQGSMVGAGGTQHQNVVFNERAIVIEVKSLSDPKDVQQGAEQLFEKFKRLVERENMRNYRPARV